MSKDSTKKALDSYMSRQLKTKQKRGANGKPEKEVERACLAWMRAQGWQVQIYAASSTYSPSAGRWIGQAMKAGTVDCQGLLPDGTFVAVEFKAPGRLKTFNLEKNTRQREYLIQKIKMNAFGCVVDSARRLQMIFDGYKELMETSKDQAQMFLLRELP